MYTSIWNGIARTMALNDVTAAKRSATDAQARAAELSDRLDHMGLILQSVWTLARDKLGITDEELAQRIQELDLSDGQLDGKIRHAAVPCPKCKRLISANRNRCIYCGEARAAADPAFPNM